MSSRPRWGRIQGGSLLLALLLYLVVLGVGAWLLMRSAQQGFEDRLLDDVEVAARLAAETMPPEDEALEGWAGRLGAATDYRITVVAEDGTVLADSHDDPATMENHGDRPEIAAALAGSTGRSTRLSESTGFEQAYVAVPADGARALRISVSTRGLEIAGWQPGGVLLWLTVLAALAGVGVVAWATRRFTGSVSALTERVRRMAEGDPDPMTITGVGEVDRLGVAITRLEARSRSRVLEARRSADTLEVVLGALPQGTILFDEDDNVVYANPASYELLGAVPDTLSGLVPFSFQEAVEDCRRLRSPVSVDAEHGKPPRILRAIASPFAADRRALLVVVDVTEREHAAAVRRDFVANASHELKTPVASILAAAEALELGVERGDQSALRFAGRISATARHLDRLVTDLLDLSRLERERPVMEPVELDRVVLEEVERGRPAAEDAGIALVAEVTPALIAGSRRDLSIAVRNLLDNALRHTRSGGFIRVELSSEVDASLRVIDSGEGIPSRDLPRVFERFYRVDEARDRASGGTGLGLAIVKHVVESHGGSVGAESELGAGSTFTVRLPLLAEQTPAAPLA